MKRNTLLSALVLFSFVFCMVNAADDKSVIVENLGELEQPKQKHALESIVHGDEQEKSLDANSSSDSSSQAAVQPDAKDGNQPAQVEPVSSGMFSFNLLKDYSRQQLAALTVGVATLGYGLYKGGQAICAWYAPESEEQEQPKITLKERDILIGLTDAMAQDVKNVRNGKRKSSLVKLFDISGLSMPLLVECNFIQNGFVQLYNQCDDQGNGVDILNLFYCEINAAINTLIVQSEII